MTIKEFGQSKLDEFARSISDREHALEQKILEDFVKKKALKDSFANLQYLVLILAINVAAMWFVLLDQIFHEEQLQTLVEYQQSELESRQSFPPEQPKK